MNLFLTLLGLLFIGLKLSHKIEWSWCAVLAPYILIVVRMFLSEVVIAFAKANRK